MQCKCGAKYEVKKRTLIQNNALHKYFELVANEMAMAGYTCEEILKVAPQLQITPSFVKRLWQEFQAKTLGKRQTRNLSKVADIDKVFDEFNLWLTSPYPEGLGLEYIPFPSKEEIEKCI